MGDVRSYIYYLLFALRKIYYIKIDFPRIRDTYDFLLAVLYNKKEL